MMGSNFRLRTRSAISRRELVDAYIAGAPQLDVSETWDEVESYLDRIRRARARAPDGIRTCAACAA